MKTKEIIGLLAIVGIATALAWYSGAYVGNTVASNGNPSNEYGQLIKYNADVIISERNSTEEPWTVVDYGHNNLTLGGRDMITNRLAGGNGAAVTYIAVGNRSGNITGLADFDGEINSTAVYSGCAEFQATSTPGTNNAISSGNWTVSKTFTATCSNIIVNSTALSNATGAGRVVFANFTFTPVTLQQNDQLNVTWVIFVQ